MGSNTENIEYFISTSTKYITSCYALRKWAHLKIATDDDVVWIRGLSEDELNSSEILHIPNIKRYYLQGAHLIPYGKMLHVMVEPTLLWSPIQRGLKVKLPKENHNFFGLHQELGITLDRSEAFYPPNVLIVELSELRETLETIPTFRTKNLRWTILDEKAIIIGLPLLPMKGDDWYTKGAFIIPAGWKIKHESIIQYYTKNLNDCADFWYLINTDNQLQKIKKNKFTFLSKGSFIKSFANE